MPTIIEQQMPETLEIKIGLKSPGGYPRQVTDPTGRSVSTVHNIEQRAADILAQLASIELGNSDDASLQVLGSLLFEVLFDELTAPLYRKSLAQARKQHRGLRLRLDVDPPELAALPWEFLYDREEDCYLGISAETPLVRYVHVSNATRATLATAVRPPLRILVVISNPSNVPQLDVQREMEFISQAMMQCIQQGLVELKIVERASIEAIAEAMRSFRPHVFHFAGHGQYTDDGAYMVLEDQNGMHRLVHEGKFREFFSNLFDTRVAVINTCYSADTSATQLLVGMAPRLLQRNLAAVIAMRHAIHDQSALVFVREFYRSIALGYPVDIAVAEGRRGIFQETDGTSPEWGTQTDWGAPTLFLNSEDGQLFLIKESNDIEISVSNATLEKRFRLYVDRNLLGRQLIDQVRAALKLPADISELHGLVGLRFTYVLRYNGLPLSQDLTLPQIGIKDGASLDLDILVESYVADGGNAKAEYRNPQDPNQLPPQMARKMFREALGHLLAHEA